MKNMTAVFLVLSLLATTATAQFTGPSATGRTTTVS